MVQILSTAWIYIVVTVLSFIHVNNYETVFRCLTQKEMVVTMEVKLAGAVLAVGTRGSSPTVGARHQQGTISEEK